MEYFFVDLVQYTFDGVFKGLLYAIVAIAFIVIYRSGRILNLAQGEICIAQIIMGVAFFGIDFKGGLQMREGGIRLT